MASEVNLDDGRVRKATAVCIRRNPEPEVLVFEHPTEHGGFMLQLPAGTIEPEEAPDVAAWRELREETGVDATLVSFAGVLDEEWDGEARRRWVYLLDAPDGLADEWPFKCDCGADTRCLWFPFESARIMEQQQPWLDIALEYFRQHERGDSLTL